MNQSDENKQPVELRVDDPDILCGAKEKTFFGLTLPNNLSARGFDIVREHIEFRRKCMNQGFDNLLENLAMHERHIFDGVDDASAEAEELLTREGG